VLPRARRRGLGAALLDAAMAFLRRQGCDRVGVAPHEYYAAGVDGDAYADGVVFLERRGFARVGEAVALGRELYDLAWPDEARAAEARLRAEGIEVGYFDPARTFALVEYFQAEFPDWVDFFVRKLDAGHAPDEIVLATHGDSVVGYCQHLDADHVGPFGVAAAYRGRGIGTVMLYRLLDAMRQKGYRFAWFGETGRARPYYERAGFRLTRTYVRLAAELRAER
jgi:GNAT superfamily N-acetyltransferase